MTTPQQRGRSNRRAGKAWQQQCAAHAREHGWPGAEYQIRNGASDLTGTGSIAVECTLEGWDKIWIKLDQAERDARARDADWWCVWKKRAGKGDPGQGAWIMPAHVGMALVQRVDGLEREQAEWQDGYDRGYTAGRLAALAQAEGIAS